MKSDYILYMLCEPTYFLTCIDSQTGNFEKNAVLITPQLHM